MRLNLGCSDRAVKGHVGVDISPGPNVEIVTDLTQEWPWADSSVESIAAYDIFEHLPDKRHPMNEAWRVLQPGGMLSLEVPNAAKGDGGFCDPTHVSYWTLSDFEYYEKGNYARERFRGNDYYGVKADFKVLGKITQSRYPTKHGGEVWKIMAFLEAVK